MRSRRLVRGTADPDVTGPYQIHDGYIHAYALGGGGTKQISCKSWKRQAFSWLKSLTIYFCVAIKKVDVVLNTCKLVFIESNYVVTFLIHNIHFCS